MEIKKRVNFKKINAVLRRQAGFEVKILKINE